MLTLYQVIINYENLKNAPVEIWIYKQSVTHAGTLLSGRTRECIVTIGKQSAYSKTKECVGTF